MTSPQGDGDPGVGDPPPVPCVWTQDAEEEWDTDCGESFVVLEGTPRENRYRFCPYCGSPLVEQVHAE